MKRRDLEKLLRIAGCYLKRVGRNTHLVNEEAMDPIRDRVDDRLKWNLLGGHETVCKENKNEHKTLICYG